jgi:predicted regulator of Ras-like GTPase activity (Roadblock/LC7/MglB family)
MATMFTPILTSVVDRVPGALGAIFADWDGEAVDQVFGADTVASVAKEALLVLGAHYGIILNQVQSALHLFHFGEAHEIVLHHDKVDLLMHAVGHGYYVVLVASSGAHLGLALRALRDAAAALRSEVG